MTLPHSVCIRKCWAGCSCLPFQQRCHCRETHTQPKATAQSNIPWAAPEHLRCLVNDSNKMLLLLYLQLYRAAQNIRCEACWDAQQHTLLTNTNPCECFQHSVFNTQPSSEAIACCMQCATHAHASCCFHAYFISSRAGHEISQITLNLIPRKDKTRPPGTVAT
jgi:hypothetical protein